MPGNAEVLRLIELLAAHEEAIQRLYEIFATKLSGQREFWDRLAAEEAGHGRLLRQLRTIADEQALTAANVGRLTVLVLRAVEQTSSRLEDVDANGVSALRALAMAQEIETFMIEARLFEHFVAPSGPAAKILSELGSATEAHSHRIDDFGRRRSRHQGLIDRGVLTERQVEMAMGVAKEEGISADQVLLGAYGVPKAELLASLEDFFGCAAHDFSSPPEPPRQAVLEHIDQLRSTLSVPVATVGWKTVVAMANPKDVVARDHVRSLLDGGALECRVALAEDILAALDRLAGVEPARDDAGTGDLVDSLSAEQLASLQEEEDRSILEDDSEVARLVNQRIEEAHALGASDIHFEPAVQGDGAVRYRVDGIMRRTGSLPRKHGKALISRLKIMADLDIAERRKPQSGKIKFRRWAKLDLDIRVETYPTVAGAEDAVLRLLAAAQARPIDELALSAANREAFLRLIHQPYGIVLCVGPTGSGKTTTLHSALAQISRDDVKILTVEDPVEISQPGLRQVQVNPKAGVTFASALRSFLRADPDVIMIGEMRDRETAGIAVESSLTGHLVFSTLHTNSAPETVVRLLNLGLDPYSFSDALLGVLAQRLVRTLCRRCRLAGPLTAGRLGALRQEYRADEAFDALGFPPARPVCSARPGGCPECGDLGYRGRMAVHELLVATDEIKELVCRQASAAEIRKVAASQGMRTLKQDGIEKHLAGHTTMEEVRSVCSR
ncbi:MAG TPA: ATPase, T2SS/T4P/T4SS family [Planctomycetota bacterium]|nr:ATPase, T2SS/T4P/T4SS family [Planctomycetota bacterium]